MKEPLCRSEFPWESFKRAAERVRANPNILTDMDARSRLSEEENEILDHFTNSSTTEMMNLWVAEFRRQLNTVYDYVEEKSSVEKISNPRFKLWYERQTGRNRFQSKTVRYMEGLYYLPVAFELSDGCSVGCDFCCLSAGRLSKVYRYTEEHAKEWQEILSATREILGDTAGAGICYFATEPFDNPDYECFIKDYIELLGYCPQTTTAVSDRNPARIKKFMEMLGEKELVHAAIRFSVTSLAQLERIYQAFTPKELEYVELLLNNPESSNAYTKSGRSVELANTLGKKNFIDTMSSVCVMGFVVNMARRTIMLVYAHRPDREHIKGMKVCDQRSFSDVKNYREVLLDMIEQHMPLDFPKDLPMRLYRYVSFERCGYRLKIFGDGICRNITMDDRQYTACKMLLEGNVSFHTIVEAMHFSTDDADKFLKTCRLLYTAGYMEEVREADKT